MEIEASLDQGRPPAHEVCYYEEAILANVPRFGLVECLYVETRDHGRPKTSKDAESSACWYHGLTFRRGCEAKLERQGAKAPGMLYTQTRNI